MQTADQAGKKPGNGYTDIVIPPIDSMESQLKPYVLPQCLRHHQLSKAERVKIYMKLGCNCQCRARERDGNQKKLRVGGPCDKTKAAFEMAMDLLKSKGTNTSASESSDNSESAPPPKKPAKVAMAKVTMVASNITTLTRTTTFGTEHLSICGKILQPSLGRTQCGGHRSITCKGKGSITCKGNQCHTIGHTQRHLQTTTMHMLTATMVPQS